jgi:DeoR family fructose operon transcriptional repressor
MLQEERFEYILTELTKKSAVKVSSLAKALDTSESTIRRDINELDEDGKVRKVFGGAVSVSNSINTIDTDMVTKQTANTDEKDRIAKYAASLINANDFVFIDAGTTTEHMIKYIDTKVMDSAFFVTNGITHAVMLNKLGFRVYVPGGILKNTTEAIVGATAVEYLEKCNFTKCFMGVNGIDTARGFTTPDMDEAKIKSTVLKNAYMAYILGDHSKFGDVSSVTFGKIKNSCIITDKLPDEIYRKYTVVEEVK